MGGQAQVLPRSPRALARRVQQLVVRLVAWTPLGCHRGDRQTQWLLQHVGTALSPGELSLSNHVLPEAQSKQKKAGQTHGKEAA